MTAPPLRRPPRVGRPKKKLGPRGVEYRRVGALGNSLYVTLSPGCARMLKVKQGDAVQVLPHASGKVVIAPIGYRVGVEQQMVAAAREVVTLRRELLKAKKRLLALPVRQVARGFSVGFMKAYSADKLAVRRQLDVLTGQVAGLCALLAPYGIPSTAEEKPVGAGDVRAPA